MNIMYKQEFRNTYYNICNKMQKFKTIRYIHRYYKSRDNDNYSTSEPIYYTHTSPNKSYTKK